MNIDNLTNDELLDYCFNGVIDSVPSHRVLKITSELEQQVKELTEELYQAENRYEWWL